MSYISVEESNCNVSTSYHLMMHLSLLLLAFFILGSLGLEVFIAKNNLSTRNPNLTHKFSIPELGICTKKPGDWGLPKLTEDCGYA